MPYVRSVASVATPIASRRDPPPAGGDLATEAGFPPKRQVLCGDFHVSWSVGGGPSGSNTANDAAERPLETATADASLFVLEAQS